MTKVTFCRGAGRWRNEHTPGQGKGPGDEADNGLERVGGVGEGGGTTIKWFFLVKLLGL